MAIGEGGQIRTPRKSLMRWKELSINDNHCAAIARDVVAGNGSTSVIYRRYGESVKGLHRVGSMARICLNSRAISTWFLLHEQGRWSRTNRSKSVLLYFWNTRLSIAEQGGGDREMAISDFLLVAAIPALVPSSHRVCPYDADPGSTSPEVAKPAISVDFSVLRPHGTVCADLLD